jgi:hypothetical protein
MAPEFFAAFGHDGIGIIGTPTINSGDMAAIMMVAIQALEKRTVELKNKKAGLRELREKIAQLNRLRTETAELTCKQAHFESIAGRLEALEVKFKFPLQWHVVSGENLAEAKPSTWIIRQLRRCSWVQVCSFV